jgi:hypothetical protein
MSLYTLLFLGSTPIGSLVIGTLADHVGVRATIATVAGVCLLGTLGGLVFLRAHPAAEPAPASQSA